MQYAAPCRSKLRRAERRYQSHKYESRKLELRRRLFARYGFEHDAVSDPCVALAELPVELHQVVSELATATWFSPSRLTELAALAHLDADAGEV